MTVREFGLLVWFVCVFAWLAVCLPAIVHLSMTWYRGRNRVFKQLCEKEIRLYYQYFAPTDAPREGEDPARHFEDQFARIYGRRRYTIPLIVLAGVSGAGFYAMASTIQAWQSDVIWSPWGTMRRDGCVALPEIAAAAFMGAFTWVVTDQLQRLRTGDLTPHDVAICALRILVSVPFGYAFARLAQDGIGVPLAYLLGTFPTGAVMRVGQRLLIQRLPALAEDTTRQQGNELECLQCVSRSNAERFMEEGVNTVSELANTDPVELALRTNQPFDYVLDCAAQAIVWVYFTDKLRSLIRYSLRSAYDATVLIEQLEAQDSDERRCALATLEETAQIVEVSPDALRHTLVLIARAPLTRFLVELSTLRFQHGQTRLSRELLPAQRVVEEPPAIPLPHAAQLSNAANQPEPPRSDNLA